MARLKNRAVTVKARANTAVSKAKKMAFLEHLRATGYMKQACEVAGISPFTPYQWAARSEEFKAAFREAKEHGEKVALAECEAEIQSRMLAGKEDPGSANLLMFRTKRLDPLYRDNAGINLYSLGPTSMSFTIEQGPASPALPNGGQVIDAKPISPDREPE